MIITGGLLLLTSLTLLLAGGLRASVRQLMGAAIFAALGVVFVLIGAMVARAKRHAHDAQTATAAAQAPTVPNPAAVPIPLEVAAPAPAFVVYVPASSVGTWHAPSPT
jgi:hypothetical protein